MPGQDTLLGSKTDLAELVDSDTQVPILKLYYQTLSSTAGNIVIVLLNLLLVTSMGCLSDRLSYLAQQIGVVVCVGAIACQVPVDCHD